MFTLQHYINLKGASVVAKEMNVELMTVKYWVALKSAPKPHTSARLIALTNGLLTWESIYQPYVDQNNEQQLELDFGETKNS